MRSAAALVCMKCILAPVAAVLFLYGFIDHDDIILLSGMVLMFITVALVIAQWLVAARTHCPLCITPVLASKNCSRHRSARRLLGSYRLRVATSVLFTGTFRCPYCGESTILEARERGGR
jgi:hypothetical protein